MSNVIEFQSPAQLRKLLVEREEEIKALKAEINNLSAVKEMLQLQALDLRSSLGSLVEQMQIIQQNVDNLLKKLDL